MPFIGIDAPAYLISDIASYYNCIHRLDAGVGMLMDVLKNTGVEENTIIIFLGDNGPEFVRAKATCFDAGVHVPFLVRWPGVVKPGSTSDALVSCVDITPTLLDAAGINFSEVSSMSGLSMVPLLNGKAHSIRQFLAVEFTTHSPELFFPQRGILDGQYLYFLNLAVGTGKGKPVFLMQPWSMPSKDHPMYEVFKRAQNPPQVELYDVVMN